MEAAWSEFHYAYLLTVNMGVLNLFEPQFIHL